MKRTIEGIIPPFVLLELARQNPSNTGYTQTITETQKLFLKGQKQLNARKGKKSKKHPRTGTGAQRKIYDAKNSTRLPGTKARFEGEKAILDNIVNDAYEGHGIVRDFLKAAFGRDSVDNKGMDLIGTVHYGKNYDNAFWNSVQMTYGDGDGDLFLTFVILDVMGHEMNHGVTEHESGLDYYGQSGALNEHYSDVMGVLCRQWKNKATADQDSWLVGPGLLNPKVGRALRDMLKPGTAYNSPRIGKDPQPDHMSRYVNTGSDNGGVHINSGIPNKAFATFAVSVGGYAWEKCGKVWYLTNCGPNHVGSDCDFQTWANKTVEVCKAEFPEIVDKLVAAWAGVGITVAK